MNISYALIFLILHNNLNIQVLFQFFIPIFHSKKDKKCRSCRPHCRAINDSALVVRIVQTSSLIWYVLRWSSIYGSTSLWHQFDSPTDLIVPSRFPPPSDLHKDCCSNLFHPQSLLKHSTWCPSRARNFMSLAKHYWSNLISMKVFMNPNFQKKIEDEI